nr:Protein BATH-37 [Haemonchus contortus]
MLNHTGMEDSGEGPPVLPFLPPTEEPSSAALAISVALVGCLTIAICGNASQMVLQVYTRRLTWKIPPQCFIATLLFINFLVPLGLPSVILEKLVRIWMFGRVSCHAHHILTTAGRVVIPWTIAALHGFVAMFLSRPNRLTRYEGVLISLTFSFLTVLVLVIVIPQGLAAELELIRKDQIDSDQYIMLIHTYRCNLKPELYPVTALAKFAFEFAVPLLLSVYFQLFITSRAKLKSSKAVSRNLIYVVIIHYCCNILPYIPEAKRNILFTALPEDADLQQLLPFLSPTLIWYPLSQLSAKLSRCNSDKIEEDLARSRILGRTTETERSRLVVTPQDL